MRASLFSALAAVKILSLFGAKGFLPWNLVNAFQILEVIPLCGVTLPDTLRNFFKGFDFEFLPNIFEIFVPEKDKDVYKTY